MYRGNRNIRNAFRQNISLLDFLRFFIWRELLRSFVEWMKTLKSFKIVAVAGQPMCSPLVPKWVRIPLGNDWIEKELLGTMCKLCGLTCKISMLRRKVKLLQKNSSVNLWILTRWYKRLFLHPHWHFLKIEFLKSCHFCEKFLRYFDSTRCSRNFLENNFFVDVVGT